MKRVDLFQLRLLAFAVGHFLHTAPPDAMHKRMLRRWEKLLKSRASCYPCRSLKHQKGGDQYGH